MTFKAEIPAPPDPGGLHVDHYMTQESLEAYEHSLDKLQYRRRVIYDRLHQCGMRGSTAEEMYYYLQAIDARKFRTINCVAPIFTHLKRKGLICWTGFWRLTESNRRAKVWVTYAQWVKHHTGSDTVTG